MRPDESDSTHFWIYCPGCAYEGKLGVPKNHPSDAVVCPQCRSVVNVRPEDRILWEPAKGEFWERQIGGDEGECDAIQPMPAVTEMQHERTPRLTKKWAYRTLWLMATFAIFGLVAERALLQDADGNPVFNPAGELVVAGVFALFGILVSVAYSAVKSLPS